MAIEHSRPAEASRTGRLVVLDLSAGCVIAMNSDGTAKRVIANGCRLPDGVAVDAEAGHVYWTNMGVPDRNDGSIERADVDGRNRRIIVPAGGTFTPKQLHLEKSSQKLYWADREGMRVMRANLDGSEVETLVATGQGDGDRPDATRWCVGITVDPLRGHSGYLAETFRAGIQSVPAGHVEAGRACGLSERVILWRIVLPQVVRRMLPEAVNQFVSLFKATTIVSLIAVPDLMYGVGMVIQTEMRPLPLYTGAAVVYFAIILVAATALRAASERWRAKILA